MLCLAVRSIVCQVLNSEWIGEMHDAKIGLTGKPMKAEYKRLTLEEEQASAHASGICQQKTSSLQNTPAFEAVRFLA